MKGGGDGESRLIGTVNQGLIVCEDGKEEEPETRLSFTELLTGNRRDLARKSVIRRKSICLDTNVKRECIHASLQYLDKVKSSEKGNGNGGVGGVGGGGLQFGRRLSTGNNGGCRFALLVVVWREQINTTDYYSASVSLLAEKNVWDENTGNLIKVEVQKVTELKLVNKFERKFHAHLLPPYKRPDEESDQDTTEETKVSSFKNRIAILNLDESE